MMIPFPSAQQQTVTLVTTSGSSFTGALIGAQLVKKYGYKHTFLIVSEVPEIRRHLTISMQES